MQIQSNDFFFDKTELFSKIKKVETILGIGDSNFNINDLGQRLVALENELVSVIDTYTTKTYVDNRLIQKVSKLGDSILANIELLTTPTANNHIVHKGYVDDINSILNANIINLENTLTTIQNTYTTKVYVDNEIVTIQDEVNTLQSSVSVLTTDPVTKGYVDSNASTKLSLTGGTMVGSLILANDPTIDSEATTKRYVDLISAGIKTKPSVNLMSLINIAGVFSNNILTGTSTGVLVVDGEAVKPQQKLLLGNQLDPRENGAYIVVNPGSGSEAFIIERAELVNESSEIAGSYFFVTDGTDLNATGWILVVNDPDTFVLNTDLIYVIQFSGRSLYIAGNGLNLVGNTFHINTENAGRIVVNADSIDLALTGVSSGIYTKLTVDSYGRVTEAAYLTQSDIPTLSWTKVALDRPTTLEGYGITDAVKKIGDTMTGPLTLSNDPSANLHAATKQYVDTKNTTLSNSVISQVSNLQSQINTLNSDLTDLSLDPVTKSYVDSQDAGKLNLTGGTMTGPIVLSGLPVSNLQAANKQYVDSSINTLSDMLIAVDQASQLQIDDLHTRVTSLQVDPVTKTYVDTVDALKLNKTGDSMTGFLTLHANPTANLHAVTKQYVDAGIATLTNTKFDKTGGTLTGALILAGDPTAPLHAVTKQYVDEIELVLQADLDGSNNTLQNEIYALQSDVSVLKVDPTTKTYVDSQDSLKINRSGDTLTSALKLDYVPVDNKDAVNKQYVDNISSGIKPRLSVKYATVDHVDGSYTNGTGGIGAHLTGFSVGMLIIDGHAAQLNDRVILKNQNNKLQNGPYRIINDGQSGAFILERENNYNESVEIPGSEYYVESGNTLARTSWVAIVANPSTFVLGTNEISFSQSGSQASAYTAGSGLNLNGTAFAITLDNNSGLSLGNQSLSILVKDSTLLKDGSGIYLNPAIQSSIDDKVSISGNTSVTGNILISSTGSLKSNAIPSVNNDVVTKGYVDSTVSGIQSQVNIIQSTINSLNTDPINKTYVDNQLALKLNKAGDSMTGFLTLSGAPTSGLHAATKQYVDSAITTLTNYINTQDSARLSLSGGTMTGPLVLSSDPIVNMNAATKQYVDVTLENVKDILDAKDILLQSQVNLVQSTVNTLNSDPVTKSYTDNQLNLKLNKAGDTMTGFLTLSGAPTSGLHAATKQYVDSGLSALNAANITSGTLPASRLPAFTGDVTSIAGSTAMTLSNSGVIAGTYTKVTTDLKGRITSGSNLIESDIPDLSWNKIVNDKPTTMAGYGITDGLTLSGGTFTGPVILNADPLTNLQAATKQYVDSTLGDKISRQGDLMSGPLTLSGAPTELLHAATKQYVDSKVSLSNPVGTIIVSSLNEAPSGYLRCNGAMVPSSQYQELCTSLSDKTNIANFGSGKHWRQQFLLSKGSSLSSFTFATNTSLPISLNNHKVCVINNDNMLIIGGNTSSGNGYTSNIYLTQIDTAGIIRGYTLIDNLPISVGNHDVIVYGSFIYVIGGFNGSNGYNTVYRAQYNVGVKTLTDWELVSTLPYAVYNHSAIMLNNRIYLLGGNINSTTLTDNVICADIKEDGTVGNWVYAAKLPMSYKDFSLSVTKNKLYLIGGNTSATAVISVTNIYSTDFEFSKWTIEASLPIAMSMGTSVVIRNMIYIIGNYTTSVTRNIYYSNVDDSGNISPFTLSNIILPTNIANHEIAIIANKLHLIGGLKSNGSFANNSYYTDFLTINVNYNYSFNEIYNSIGYGIPDQLQHEFNSSSNTLSFSSAGTLPSNLYNITSFVTNNYLYLIGGATSLTNATNNNLYRYPINSDGTLGAPVTLTGPSNFTLCSVILSNKTLYLIGGYNGTNPLTSVYKCTVNTDGTLGAWTSVTAIPVALFGHSSVLIKNRIYVFGGYTSSGVNTNIYCATIISSNNISTWNIAGSLPEELTGFKLVCLSDRLYIIGGKSGSMPINKVYYCIVNNDGSLGEWNTSLSLPIPLYNFSVITTSDSIYVIGGISSSNSNSVYKAILNIDHSLSNWSLVTTIPIALSNTAVSIVKNKMYLFGGYNGTGIVNTIYQSDFLGGRNNYISNILPINVNNIMSPRLCKDQYQFNTSGVINLYSFANERTLPVALQHTNAIITNDTCYTLGGHNGSTPVSTIYKSTITDGKLDIFTANAVNLPVASMKHMSAIIGDKLYVIGGITTGTNSRNTVYVNNLPNTGLITSAFTTDTALPTAIDSGDIIVTSSRVYVLGGNTNNVASNLVYSAPIESDNTLGNWVAETNLPVALRDFKAVYLKDYVYLIGGRTNVVVNTVYRAPVGSDGVIGTFTLYGNLPTAISNFDLVTINSRLFIIGGVTTGDVPTQNTYIVPIQSTGALGLSVDVSGNIQGVTLNPLTLPVNNFNTSVVITSNTLYLIGGFNTTTLNSVYGSIFTGGKDNYLHSPFNTHPLKFKLPEFTNTGLDIANYNVYIKY